MDTIAKHNIVVMALLTQTEAQRQKAAEQSQQGKKEDERNSSTGDLVSSERALSGQTVHALTGPQWHIKCDYSVHNYFAIITVNK